MKIIGIQMDRCTGCKTCELFCAAERGSEGKTLAAAVKEKPLPQARIRVEGSGTTAFPLQCRQCASAPCIDACLAGALVRDGESSIVLVKEERCIGCWTCTAFCPYGVIYPSWERKVALKCDRCLYMERPVCVEVCPTKALNLVDTEGMEGLSRGKRKDILKGLIKSEDGLLL